RARRGGASADVSRPPSAEVWTVLESVFNGAVELAPEEREAYLDRACAGHPSLRACVVSLLAQDGATGWLRGDVAGGAEDLPTGRDWSGRELGPYRLVRKLGEGGMGSVYLAERSDGEYQQSVAIKVMHGGPLRESLRQRFLVERQILARLEHPHIARFLGGGTTSSGIPYLVMEWLDGEPLLDHCERRGLDLDQRLELFRQVLDAVEYAHRNLIVHRDLKPSNIFVVESPTEEHGDAAERACRVKLLDFGIAKWLDDEGDADLTRLGQRPMTPAYASPEQRLGAPITTVSDVYSLGLVLYELSSGRRAIESGRASVVPKLPPPSEVADRDVAESLRGEIDRIVLRAVEPDPEARYASAAAFDDDLGRYARNEPIAAMPPRLPYLARKFLRRHRSRLAAALVLVAAVGWGFVAQHREATAARAAEAETGLVVDYLVRLFEMARPESVDELPETLAEVVDLAATESLATFEDSPRLRARLQHTLGRVSFSLGDFERSAELLDQAVELRRNAFGPDHVSVAESLHELGRARQLLDRYDRAEEAYAASLEILERSGDAAAVAETLGELSVVYRHVGRYDEAVAVARRSLAMKSARPDLPPAELATALDHLALALENADELEEPIALSRRALELRRQILGPLHPDLAMSLNGLGVLQSRAGDLDATIESFSEALAIRQEVLPEGHASLGQSHYNLAQAYFITERYAESRPHIEHAIAIWRSGENPNPLRSSMSQLLLGDLEAAAGREAPARQAYEQGIETMTTALGEDHPNLLEAYWGFADLECRFGHLDRARRHFDRALEIALAHHGPESSSRLQLAGSRRECLGEEAPAAPSP
ncbi:MAG: serine/threonine-protein kinase, partial [Acidobacteriota bacterium]